MTQKIQSEYESCNPSGPAAEETLRLLTQLPAPAELADRVHHRLAIESAALAVPARRGFWSHWMPAQRLQFAAAAILVAAVGASTWSVYHSRPHVQPQTGQNIQNVPAAARSASSGSFGTASAERVPLSLNPIKVPPAPRKKPGAGRIAIKRAPKAAPAQPDGAASPTP
jgi:hypothetical protein